MYKAVYFKKKKHNQFEINLSIMLQLGLSVSNMCL